jgi:beta-lactamase regulating signal transducer with metallopeptidase domain
MTTLAIEAALRSLLLALAVWTVLRLFRVRNVMAEKAAWILVLAAAVAMPLMLVLAARWPGLPVPKLVLPAMAVHRPARAIPLLRSIPVAEPARPTTAAVQPAVLRPSPGALAQPRAGAGRVRPPVLSKPLDPDGLGLPGAGFAGVDTTEAPQSGQGVQTTDAAKTVPAHASPTLASLMQPLSFASGAAVLYLFVAFALCLRLLLGLAVTLRVWQAAEPVSALAVPSAEGLSLRASQQIATPVTIGSGVLLPAEYAAWGEEKLRIVLAHERSHVRQGDFYLQLLASLYAALLWLSPLGWWLKRKLSDLGEAIGDRSGLEEAQSRAAYARVLLEFAAAPRNPLLGVAMARPSSLSRRMERLLNESAFRQAFSRRGRAFAAALVLPAIFLAAAALVRVEAAGTPAQAVHAPQRAGAGAPPHAVQAPAAQAETADDATEAACDMRAANADEDQADEDQAVEDAPQAPSAPFAAPVIRLEEAQEQQAPEPEGVRNGIVLESSSDSASSGSSTSGGAGAGQSISRSYTYAFNQATETITRFFGGHALVQLGGSAADGSFDRTLSFSGQLELHVATGSGNIHLTRGTAGQVVVHGHVHSKKAEDADEVRALAGNPPIEQDGNVIRIGAQRDERRTNHVSIDYEIEAPADTTLAAASGSGDIVDEGVGQGAKLESGSGNITATGLTGGFKTETGSGNISIDEAGEGDAKAETGSGDIEVKGVHGALKAETGSGSIKATGTPSSEWKLETGSGDVEFAPGNAGITLDASTGSGAVTSDHPMALHVSSNGHKVSGQLNGGGPAVVIETGSGDVHIRD